MSNPPSPIYADHLSPALLAALLADAEPVLAVPGLRVSRGLRGAFEEVETDEALAFVCRVYGRVRGRLAPVLAQRRADRAFVDAETAAMAAANVGVPFRSAAYRTALGARDAAGRVVVGPLTEAVEAPSVMLPPHLRGAAVTYFAPADTEAGCREAMAVLGAEGAPGGPVVEALVAAAGAAIHWGADSEDSRTPMATLLLESHRLLGRCFDGTIGEDDALRHGRGAGVRRSQPIKRIPGLGVPDGHHLLNGEALPLHVVDLGLHAFHHRRRAEALSFYVPKLENEEEAAYVAALLDAVEEELAAVEPGFVRRTLKVIVVFENPRAIFRVGAMAQALGGYFAGGSLGWHDFLAGTARLMRDDPRFRMPAKSDPSIVINHIRASHDLLVRELGPEGGLKIGGMYGVLFDPADAASVQVALVGYVKDAVTQLRRGLDGFWVAHPALVRVGVAVVEAWRRRSADGHDGALAALIGELIEDPMERDALLAFVRGPDAAGLALDDPLYLRGVLAASLEPAATTAEAEVEELRYNLFQTLQYLAGWLTGDACVALPASRTTARGQEVFVRVLDDLASAERSRWQLWAEVAHGRVDADVMSGLLDEELAFIREGRQTATKRVQVRWDGEAARWYPVAAHVLRRLVLASVPVEFATELLLPFTLRPVREAEDAWKAARALCPGRYDS